ncbi:hypothetical protein ACWCPS_33465 [Streptomyces mauvecolor]
MSALQDDHRPFLPADFDEPCEDCKAPAGSYCRPGCSSGYTADDARADAQSRASNSA